jgi:hypothetical protein
MNSKIINKLSGKFFKCPGRGNELWYLSPSDNKRKLITIINAPLYFRRLFVKIDEESLSMIPSKDEPDNNQKITFRKKNKGKFIMAENNASSIWYINENLKKERVTSFDLLDLLSAYAESISVDELKLMPQ